MSTHQIEPTTVKQSSAIQDRATARKRNFSVLTPYLFLAPYLILFSVFVLVPAVFGLWISLHNWNYLLPNKPFVGLDNYSDLFNPDSVTGGFFWQSMGATLIFTLLSVPVLLVVPLAVAMALNVKFRGQKVFRAIFFAPYILGVAVIGILWRFVLDPNFGVLNYYLGKLGLPSDTPWTTGLPWAWLSLVGVTVWWTLGFNTVIYLAGLQNVDVGLYDAAKVDGANAWERFRHITLPGLRPVLLFVLTVTILGSANVFGQPYIITQGAPGNDTRSVIMYIANEGLHSYRMGSAAAMSYILALFLAVISVINFRFFTYRGE